VLLVGLLLCFVTGYIVDRLSQPRLDAMKRSAVQELEGSLITGPGNAWPYYEEALDRARGIELDGSREAFVYGKIAMTPEINKTIQENQDVLALLIRGATQPHCSALFNTRSILSRHNTNLYRLKIVTQVLCARALYELEKGNSQQALEDLCAAMTIAKHICELSPTILDQLSGVNLLHWALLALKMGIASGSFSEQELSRISAFLKELEEEWPNLSVALEKHVAFTKIMIASSSISTTADLLLLPHHGRKPSALLRLLLRLRYWRYFFSPRRAFIDRFELLDAIVLEMEQIEEASRNNGRWYPEQSFPGFFQERLQKHHKRNRIPELFTPRFTNIGLLYNLTTLRMLNCGALVARHREAKGTYPEGLSEFDTSIATDPNTGTPWEYRITGNGAILRSPGLNLKEKSDDIMLLLNKRGIASYLSQKRKLFSHE
jgi:hypothetical protein